MTRSCRLTDFPMNSVRLLDEYELNAFALESDYLKYLDADRLLRGFCDIAGIESSAELYDGWENSAIRGHTLGHYLTALSQAYAMSGDAGFLERVDHVVAVLAKCQNKSTGYLAAIPESHYERIEQGTTEGTWVPWYTMHKIISGLLAAAELAGSAEALEVASRLGDWVYSRTSAWSAEVQTAVLNVEYGGMNDCMYQLYRHTGSEKHLSAAHSFDEMPLFDALHENRDVLNGKHANTTIPKIIGALNRYLTLGGSEAYYLEVAENFWDMVVGSHTYITGGNSEWEHFGEPGVLDAERTNCNCETCNTYNMLKLSRGLFTVTGNRRYADYYENTYINAILSSQNPETGMTTYFQPMATGFFKVFSSRTEHFWCCTGSGMENFSKLNDSIYFSGGSSVWVTRYTSSRLEWKEKGLVLTQRADIPHSGRVLLTVEGSAEAEIVLRVPEWCSREPKATVSASGIEMRTADGFIHLSGAWSSGNVITLELPMRVTAHTLPDNRNAVAFRYGPVVLSADLGRNAMTTGTTGVNVTVPTYDPAVNDVIFIKDGTAGEWLDGIERNLVRNGDALEFTLRGTDRDIVFAPHYRRYDSRYGIYFILADRNTAVRRGEADRYETVDSLPVANDQYEFAHGLRCSGSSTGLFSGRNYRDAAPGGWFSYDMAVESGTENFLAVRYFSGNAGRSFSLFINGRLLETVTVENVDPGHFYDVYYPIPTELTAGNRITAEFRADRESTAGGIFDRLSVVKAKK